MSVAETLEMCIEMLTIEPHVGTDSVNRKLLGSMTSSSSWWPSQANLATAHLSLSPICLFQQKVVPIYKTPPAVH
jgi:hypothetical protein